MFKGMSFSIAKLRLDKAEPHEAASAACKCYFDWWYDTPIGSNRDVTICGSSNFIFARPLIIRKRSKDYVLMHFDMVDSAFGDPDMDNKLDVFVIENEISDKKIELISWLYTIDFYEQAYNDEASAEVIMEHLNHYDMSFLKKLKKQRPSSEFLKLAIKTRLADSD